MSSTDKIYEYSGKYYSNTDHSLDLPDNKWGGDLYDLFWDASHGDCSGELCETTLYYSAYNPETVYDDVEDLVEDFFEDSEISYEDMIKETITYED